MNDNRLISPLQRLARFNLIVFVVAVALYVLCVPTLAWLFHQTLAFAAVPALGVFGVCGLWGFGNHFLYDRRRQAKVALDEREEFINRRATMIGMFMFWEVFVLLCMGVWGILRYACHQVTMSVDFLPLLVFLGMIVFTVTQSVAILLQYRGSSDDT